MKVLKKCDMTSIILTTIYKITIYACWYLFAFMFLNFLREGITDTKLILLFVSLIVIYTIRLLIKFLYKSIASKSYYNIKHNIEMHYFSLFENLEYKAIEEMDLNGVSNNILEVSYNVTKLISDIGEYIIPCLLGVLILFIKFLDINVIMGLAFIIFLIITIISSYNKIEENNSINNYNDMLKDFIGKMLSIKRLNVFNFCYRTLDANKDEDIVFLKNSENNDVTFGTKVSFLIIVLLVITFFFISDTTSRLGLVLFVLIIMIKLIDLLYEVNPFIKNFFATFKNIKELEDKFNNVREITYHRNFKKVLVKDGKISYETNHFELKIPEFEVLSKDHISIMGKSGEGKSTILNILSGLFQLDSGSILVDEKISKKYINSYFSTPNTEILNLTLRDNLLLGEYISDEKIIEYFHEVGLVEWYSSLSDGLDTLINDDVEMSIRQKINLLRGIIQNRECYFLDNPTLGLDIDSEKKVAGIIKKHFKDKTYIIVSNRPIITTLCKKHYFIKDHTLKSKEPLL